MTNDEFIKRVMYYVSDEYLQELAGRSSDYNVGCSPEDFSKVVAFGMIRFLIEDFKGEVL